MPPTARKLVRPQPEAASDFLAHLCAAVARQLGKKLRQPIELTSAKQCKPAAAHVAALLQKPDLKTALDLGAHGQAFCVLDDALARNIIALRLGAKPNGKPLSLVEHALCAVVPEAIQAELAHWLKQAHVAPQMPATTALPAPESGNWRVFCLSFTQRGAHLGCLYLALPADCLQPSKPHTTLPPTANHAQALGRAMQAAPLSLRAILHRENIASGTLGALRIGDFIALPDGCLRNLQIALCDQQATPIAQAQLGAYEGKKVLKLLAAPKACALALPQGIAAE